MSEATKIAMDLIALGLKTLTHEGVLRPNDAKRMIVKLEGEGVPVAAPKLEHERCLAHGMLDIPSRNAFPWRCEGPIDHPGPHAARWRSQWAPLRNVNHIHEADRRLRPDYLSTKEAQLWNNEPPVFTTDSGKAPDDPSDDTGTPGGSLRDLDGKGRSTSPRSSQTGT